MKRGRRRRGPGNVSVERPSLLFVANSVIETQKPLNFLRILVGEYHDIIMYFPKLSDFLGLIRKSNLRMLSASCCVVSHCLSVGFLLLVTEGAIAGATAGVVVETALYPIDTIKTRLQVDGSPCC